jgi:hypothetical protein
MLPQRAHGAKGSSVNGAHARAVLMPAAAAEAAGVCRQLPSPARLLTTAGHPRPPRSAPPRRAPGGSVTAGMGIYDAMMLCRADVHVSGGVRRGLTGRALLPP